MGKEKKEEEVRSEHIAVRDSFVVTLCSYASLKQKYTIHEHIIGVRCVYCRGGSMLHSIRRVRYRWRPVLYSMVTDKARDEYVVLLWCMPPLFMC